MGVTGAVNKEKIKPNEQPDSVNNIFDTVFRTIIEYLPRLIIPVINEVFQTGYPPDGPLEVLKNEHVVHGKKIITDLFFEMEGGSYYHVEVQSATDGKMVIRIMEYATAIALERAVENRDGSYSMKFPNSCAIYLRSTKNTPDKLTMHLEFPDGQAVAFDAPLLKVQEYTKDQLFQKNLLMLLPYYLMRYEKEIKEAGKSEKGQDGYGRDTRKMAAFIAECQDLLDRLSGVCQEKEQQYLFQTLADLVIEIAVYLAPDSWKGRVMAVGGTVMKTRAQILVEQGIEQGEIKAKKETAFSLTDRGFSPEEIADIVKVGADTVEQWLGSGAVLTE